MFVTCLVPSYTSLFSIFLLCILSIAVANNHEDTTLIKINNNNKVGGYRQMNV